MINLSLIITEECQSCLRAEKKLKKILNKNDDISFTIIHIRDFTDVKIFVVPSLIIDGELFCYGDVDEKKLLKKLAEKSYAIQNSK
jgi:predicted thioredoxin/glutaredoxin